MAGDDLSRNHAEELEDAKRWHLEAPEEKMFQCWRCGTGTIHIKSQWSVGHYICKVCGWLVVERWRRSR